MVWLKTISTVVMDDDGHPKKKSLFLEPMKTFLKRHYLQSYMIKTTNLARNPEMVMYFKLYSKSHINIIPRSAYCHLKKVSKIRAVLEFYHAFIFSQVIYCNVLFGRNGLEEPQLTQIGVAH